MSLLLAFFLSLTAHAAGKGSSAGTDELVLEAPAKLRAAEPSRAAPPKNDPPNADELCAAEKAATEEASSAVQNCGAKCNSGKALLAFQHAREAYEACYEKAQKK